MVYEHTEEQRLKRKGPFNAQTLWLRVDPAVVMSDIIGTLFEALGNPIPDLTSLSPHNQAVALFNVLNTASKPRLIILDQFENLLDWRTGFALPERTGVGEWLDAINSRKCTCRMLLTSRPWPHGTQEYPPTYMQEYHVEGLEKSEGIGLLRKQGVQATETELSTAVEYCKGHALSLTLLATLLRNRSVNLSLLLKDPLYTQLWEGNIASNLLDSIYTEQLNEVQQRLLVAFSIYREPVTLESAQTVMSLTPVPPQQEVEHSLDALLTQHLIQAKGEGRYQLHIIVESYVKNRIVVEDKLVNQQTLREAHAKAALYYQQEAVTSCPPRKQRKKISDFHDLIEAVWHYYQAEQWQEGYALLEQEEISEEIAQVGGYVIIFELYQLLLPLDKWHPNPSQTANIYSELGWMNNLFGKREKTIKYYEEVLRMRRKLGDRKEEGEILNRLGVVLVNMGSLEVSISYCKEALSIAKEVGDSKLYPIELYNLGSYYDRLDNKAESLRYFEEMFKFYNEKEDHEMDGDALNRIGAAYGIIGKYEEAVKYYERSLSKERESELKSSSVESMILNNLGESYARIGIFDEAIKCHEEVLGIAKDTENRWLLGETLNDIGMAYKKFGKHGDACDYYEQALKISRELEYSWLEIQVLNNLGELYKDLEKYQEAIEYFERGQSVSIEIGNRWFEFKTLKELGKVNKELDREEKAFKYYKQALKVVIKLGIPSREGLMLKSIGELFFEQNRYDFALAFFLLAKEKLEEVQSPEFDKILTTIEGISEKIGEKQFAELLASVEPQTHQMVEQALSTEMNVDYA